jgi:hypothetical protein
MSQTRTCPVCGRPGLPPNCGSCPQCDADLTCFQALDSLASPAAAKAAAPPKRRFPWAAAAALALIAMLLLAGLAASMKSRLSELDRQLAEMKAAESKPPEKPAPAAAESAAEQAKLPPESKIQIDARVRIIDEREAAQAAGKQAAEEPKQLAADAPKRPAPPAVKPAEERKPAAETAQAAVVHQPAAPVKQIAAPPKVVSETIRQPDADAEEAVGAAMPPLPAAKPAEQSAAVQKKIEEEQQPVPSSAPPNSPEESDKAELAADLPETPPVLLKPGFRKHRARPVSPPAVRENLAPHPAAAAENSAPPAAEPQRGGSFSYLVKDGETAWDIAERFYGDRKYYPVVMEQNPHIFLGFIRKNSTVRLFADRREAAALYQRKIEQRDGLLLWSYDVRPGETWRSIYARFFLPRYSGMIFYGDQDVAPGKTVRIILR